jgi:hypothetical protein
MLRSYSTGYKEKEDSGEEIGDSGGDGSNWD